MFRKALVAMAAATAAVAIAAAPAGASSDTAAAVSTKASPAPNAVAANTAYSQITHFFCGRINGTPYVGAQSRQAKYTTNTYYMSSTHVVQGLRGGRWVNLNARKFYVNKPAGGVWYYAPDPNHDQLWNLSGWTGSFRVKVAFVWKTTSGTTYHATSTTTACTKS